MHAWPKSIKYWLYANEARNELLALDMKMTPTAAAVFRYAAHSVKFQMEVEESGIAYFTEINGVKLPERIQV